MKKIVFIFSLVLLCLPSIYSQEICDNGIDDDGNGLIDLNDSTCICEIENHFSNPNFEDTLCKPNFRSSTASNLGCVKDWITMRSRPEFYHTGGIGGAAGWGLPITMPPAHGGYGVIRLFTGEYMGTCLLQTLLAGVSYTFDFKMTTVNGPLNGFKFAIYGADTCPVPDQNVNFGTCPDPVQLGTSAFELLGEADVNITAQDIWGTFSVTFTPTRDIYSAMLKAPCDGNNFYPRGEYFIDDVRLYPEKPEITSLTESGFFCSNDLILKASASPVGGTWQWYKDGIAMVGQTNDNIDLSLNNLGAGTYNVRYMIAGACDTSSILTINTTPDTANFNYTDTIFCLSGTNPAPLISGTSGGMFTISNSGVINTNSGQIDLNNSGIGNYTVTYTTNGSICPDTATFNLEITTCVPPIANYTTSDTVICAGRCIDFTDLSNGATSWQWTFNGGTPNIASTQGPHNVCFSTPGIYDIQLIVSNRFGPDTMSSTIEIIATDDASFSYSSNSICDSLTSVLPSNITTSGGIFSINNGANIDVATGEINPASIGAGSYTVTHITTGICPDTTNFSFDLVSCIPPIANYSVSDTAICDGECIDFTDLSTNANAWQWTFNGGTPNNATTKGPHNVCFNGPGNYNIELTVTNQFGTNSKSAIIEVFNNPTINAGNDITIDLGQSTTLLATGTNGNYNWTPPMWLDCPTCISPIATPKETINYNITVVDSNGCIASDDISIIVDFELVIFVPNIFSPNGDGNNDVLFVRGAGVQSLNFMVYDRWGEKVFETQSLDSGWDGNFRGKRMNNAVFAYYLEATFIDGTEAQQQGDITLIR